jgi:hypothetical protein
VSLVRLAARVKDEQIAALTAALDASLGRERRLELRLAEAERRAAGPGAGEGFGPADRNPSSAVKTHKINFPATPRSPQASKAVSYNKQSHLPVVPYQQTPREICDHYGKPI